jgi:hypothetical protein
MFSVITIFFSCSVFIFISISSDCLRDNSSFTFRSPLLTDRESLPEALSFSYTWSCLSSIIINLSESLATSLTISISTSATSLATSLITKLSLIDFEGIGFERLLTCSEFLLISITVLISSSSDSSDSDSSCNKITFFTNFVDLALGYSFV